MKVISTETNYLVDGVSLPLNTPVEVTELESIRVLALPGVIAQILPKDDLLTDTEPVFKPASKLSHKE